MEAWPPVKWAARPEGPWRLKSVVNKLGGLLRAEREAAAPAPMAEVAEAAAGVAAGVADVVVMEAVVGLRLLG